MRNREAFVVPIMVLLLLALAPVGVAEAQMELAVSVGPQLSNEDLDRFVSTGGRVEVMVQRSLAGPLRVRGGLAASTIGPPPCPAPPGSQTRWHIKPGRSFEGHVDLGFGVPVGGALRLEPFVGTGLRHLTSTDAADPSPDSYGLGSSTRLLVGGGLTVSAGLGPRLGTFARVRVSRHFLDTQTLTPMDGQPLEVELRNLDTASLTAGLSLRL